jgi:hypothetical protein
MMKLLREIWWLPQLVDWIFVKVLQLSIYSVLDPWIWLKEPHNFAGSRNNIALFCTTTFEMIVKVVICLELKTSFTSLCGTSTFFLFWVDAWISESSFWTLNFLNLLERIRILIQYMYILIADQFESQYNYIFVQFRTWSKGLQGNILDFSRGLQRLTVPATQREDRLRERQ